MRKNSHGKILEGKLKKQHLNTVLKSYSYLNYIYICKNYTIHFNVYLLSIFMLTRAISSLIYNFFWVNVDF